MLLWYIAAVCAFFVKGLCGFANTLVFTTILSFGSANALISPVELLLGYPSNAIVVWRERRSVDWKLCFRLSALVLLGMIPGVILLKNADATVIKIIFGGVIFLLGLEMLLRREGGAAKPQPKLLTALIGLISGVLCGLYGVGALLGAYLSRVSPDSHAFRGNICVIFFAENTMRIVLYLLWGILTPESLVRTLMLLPAALLALLLGMYSGRLLSEAAVKRIVILMLMVSGLALVLTNLSF